MKNEVMKNNGEKRGRKLLLFCAVLLPRLILILLFAGVFRTSMDEMSTISTGAYFGGKDWTALTTYARFYYGGGFTILFAPLFRLLEDSRLIYLIMLSVCAILQSISAPISYHIMKKYLKITNEKFLVAGSIASSFMVVTRAMEVFNEHIIIACVWVIALLLCRLVDNRDNYRKRAVDSVLLMLVFSYMLTTHARTNVIWIAFPIVLLSYYLIYKRWLVALLPTLIAAVGGYFAAGRFNDMVKRVIWDWQEGEYLKNTGVTLDLSLTDMLNPVYWQGILSTIFGQTNTILIYTGGLALIIVVLLVCLYLKVIVERWQQKAFLPETKGNAEYDILPYLLTVSVLFFLCIGAVIAAQSLTWLPRVVRSLSNTPYNSNAYGYKAFTYMRYIGPFTGPVMMMGLTWLYYKREQIRAYFGRFVAVYAVMQMMWLGFVLPHLTSSRAGSEVFVAFGWYDIVNTSAPIGKRIYLLGTLVAGLIFIIILFLLYQKRLTVAVAIAASLLIYEYGYGAIFWDGSFSQSFGSQADAGSAIVHELEASSAYDDVLPDTFYVLDLRKSVQKRIYTYQMNLPDYTIIAQRPNSSDSREIVFARDAEDKELMAMGYAWGQLDDNEYVYVNDPTYQEMFETKGIVFHAPKQ
jgi:hypothetical protein